jgi:arsenite methyltransferase
MSITAIPDLPLADCLALVAKHFDPHAIAATSIDQASVLDYYHQSDRGYRLFHSREGAMHVALNCEEAFSTEGYLGQVELITERLKKLDAKQVLEVGCGVGYNTRHLAERVPGCIFIGVDLSESHVKSAAKDAKGLQNLSFEPGDFQRMRFEERDFDAVFAVESLCQAEDVCKALREIARVLRPGGRLLVIECVRAAPLDDCDEELRLAAQLVEKTMAVHEFVVLGDWLATAHDAGFEVRQQTDLSSEISHNLARFYSLSRRYFKMPRAARAFLKVMPSRLLENAISGLLMPFTVGSGVHRYFHLELEKRPD